MRIRDVQALETYLVEVPHRLPPHRYPPAVLGQDRWWRLAALCGTRFRLTVTDRHAALGHIAAVEGLRVVTVSYTVVDLSVEQVAELGLPPGAYRIHGPLVRVDGGPVELPEVETLRVPTRWLRHLDETPQAHTHRDTSDRSW